MNKELQKHNPNEVKIHNPKAGLILVADSIKAIERKQGSSYTKVRLAAMLDKLYAVKYSKHPLNETIIDMFYDWLIEEYYYYKLPEVELALNSYAGKTFQVIDLDTLKDIVDFYNVQRLNASETIHNSPDDFKTDAKPIPAPPETKKLLHKLAVKRMTDPIGKTRLPESLYELFTIQKRKDPEKTQKEILSLFKKEYRSYEKFCKKSGLDNGMSEIRYVDLKTSEFILKSNVRIKI